MNKNKEFEIQKKKDEYYEDYDNLGRFISYFYQINNVKRLNPKTILEIGVGNKTVYNYLKNNYEIKSCDFDKELNPDFNEDIRDLSNIKEKFDIVIACEVLEHIPWKDFNKAIFELYKISNKNVIISIPKMSADFEIIMKFPYVGKIIKKPFIRLLFQIPSRFIPKKIKMCEEHYWELERKNYSISKIRNSIKKYFKIKNELNPVLNSNHHFFILEKNKKNNLFIK